MAMRRTIYALLRNRQRAMTYVGTQYSNHQHHGHEHHYHPHHHPVGFATTSITPSSQFGCRNHYSTHAMASRSEHPIELHEDEAPATSSPTISHQETRKLLKLMKVDDFKKVLLSTGNHCMPVEEVLKLCKQTGAATTDAEAEEVTKNLDEAGVVLIFRNRVFLQPERVAELLSKTMPSHLAPENDPRIEELDALQREKDEIEKIAHRQVKRMLWGAFGAFSFQSAVFFRLTFWDLSWDVMEPITFFVTSSSLLAGFFFFVITHRDPSYHDLMNTLLMNKQQKLMKKRRFNAERFKELQVQCCIPTLEHQPHAKH
eukprot:c29627_g1_i1 orf=407-1351(+)